MPRKDAEAKREYDTQWHQANKDKVAERHQRWYQKNKEKVRLQKQQWIQDNPDEHRAYHHQWKRSLYDFINEQKQGKACVRCGIADHRVLDFHHIDPSQKTMNLAKAWQGGTNRDRILAEIAKCELLCANCHRILHWEERNGS